MGKALRCQTKRQPPAFPQRSLARDRSTTMALNQQIIANASRHHSNEKRLVPAAGPTNELEAKKLKLIFLLMMSLG